MAERVKAGLLSGMVITWGTALGGLVVGALIPGWHHVFARAPSRRLLDLLLVSIAIMAVHKLECHVTRECDHCPVYLGMDDASWNRGPRHAAFVAFCSVFLALALLLALALRGAPWPLLVIAVWAAQGLHENHHLAKSLARRRYYPGTLSALAFVLFLDVLFVPEYLSLLAVDHHAVRLGYWLAQPLLVLAFYLEDRDWQRRRGWSAPGEPAGP